MPRAPISEETRARMSLSAKLRWADPDERRALLEAKHTAQPPRNAPLKKAQAVFVPRTDDEPLPFGAYERADILAPLDMPTLLARLESLLFARSLAFANDIRQVRDGELEALAIWNRMTAQITATEEAIQKAKAL